MNYKEFSKFITDTQPLASGCRGVVHTAMYEGKKIAIKMPSRDEVVHTTEIEKDNLSLLQHFDFVPKLVSFGDDYFAYEFIDGMHLSQALKEMSENDDIKNYKKILLQMLSDLFELDKFGMFKKELIRCTKNFIVTPNFDVVMIDFERSKPDTFNKNIPQFLQFLKTRNIFTLEEVIALGSKYVQDQQTIFNEVYSKIENLKNL